MSEPPRITMDESEEKPCFISPQSLSIIRNFLPPEDADKLLYDGPELVPAVKRAWSLFKSS